MQDPPHVGKKLRNQPALLDTQVLILTDDGSYSSLDEVVVRWGPEALKYPEFLMAIGMQKVCN